MPVAPTTAMDDDLYREERAARAPDVMTRQGRWFLGAITLISLVSLAVAVTAGLITSIAPGGTFPWPPVALGAAIYHLIWTAMLLAFYVSHLVARSGLEPGAKLMWGLCFLVAAPFALPVYWAYHILPGPEAARRWSIDPGRVHVDDLPIGDAHEAT